VQGSAPDRILGALPFASTIAMIITYDHNKNRRNIAERGLSFDLAAQFDFTTALFETDERREYKEVRVRALGKIGDRLHVLVFTETFSGIRVISLRKANNREVKRYESQAKS
jgi:uncharacterized DUF497 family protein